MTITASDAGNLLDQGYNDYLVYLQRNFLTKLQLHDNLLFTTDATGLWEAYLASFDDENRQYHNCHECRRFIETYGALVCINESGHMEPAFWNISMAPQGYLRAIDAMVEIVMGSRVTGVFKSQEKKWGNPVTGDWTHFALIPPAELLHKSRIQTPYQYMAEKREDFNTVSRALAEYSNELLATAIGILKTESLYSSEKCLGVAQWLNNRQLDRMNTPHKEQARNLLWRAIATAPAGFCHPRSSMIGTLLDDLAAGLPFDDVKARFDSKMHPLKYQRPQAAPTAGNIAQAEKIVAQLGIEPSLHRRFARLEEVIPVWMPEPKKDAPAAGGVFGHLKTKKADSVIGGQGMPAQKMTWEKFARTVMPTAETIECYIPHGREAYTALLTAVDPNAPPILQWDSEERRNPVSWYVYNGGSEPRRWGLTPDKWHPVTAVTLQPSMWHTDAFEHQGAAAIFLLEGCKDIGHAGAGNALFPSFLKNELHSVRATIEAYSKGAEIYGFDEASACGLRLQKGQQWTTRVRVTSNGNTVEYQLDRWD